MVRPYWESEVVKTRWVEMSTAHSIYDETEEIAAQIPHLTLAQVHAALAYYYANRDDMDAAMAAEEAEAEQLEREQGRPGKNA